MDIILSNSSDKPIYEQISSQVKAQILSGALAAGAKLPSIRALASDLGVSVITTKRAYADLEQLGFICTVQGKGMPIVKSLIELMGGTIEVTSELHAGTSFYVEIPLDIDKNPQARANTVEGALDCSLAEDNELNAEIAQALLESEGVVVTRAANGNEVVDLYLSHPAGSFDAILMDIMMPDMDGYEATRAIRLSEKVDAADIPIIALTANAFAEDAKAAHDAGMNAHLSKPLDFNKLKNILARIKRNGSVSL